LFNVQQQALLFEIEDHLVAKIKYPMLDDLQDFEMLLYIDDDLDDEIFAFDVVLKMDFIERKRVDHANDDEVELHDHEEFFDGIVIKILVLQVVDLLEHDDHESWLVFDEL